MTDEKKNKRKAEAGGQEETCSETQQLKARTKKETLFRNPPTKKQLERRRNTAEFLQSSGKLSQASETRRAEGAVAQEDEAGVGPV